jgi:hypothetical protein
LDRLFVTRHWSETGEGKIDHARVPVGSPFDRRCDRGVVERRLAARAGDVCDEEPRVRSDSVDAHVVAVDCADKTGDCGPVRAVGVKGIAACEGASAEDPSRQIGMPSVYAAVDHSDRHVP